jgi:hypothetical protein
LLACPVCRGARSRHKLQDGPWHCDNPTCSAAKAFFDRVGGKSLLFNFADSIIECQDLIEAASETRSRRSSEQDPSRRGLARPVLRAYL